ncbi:hypothetical protein [Paraburkholderia phytofirmans]|uniref:hypothetical protein n=1 Tax=Paraburkholderia phytofirmans TaxID=261302 RepID=UPI0011DFF2E1|nr:hypothetical protein [Paraburkholderia phytofirmans]
MAEETAAFYGPFASHIIVGMACIRVNEHEIKPGWRCLVIDCDRRHTLQFQLSRAGAMAQSDLCTSDMSFVSAQLLADGVSVVMFTRAHNLPSTGALRDFAGCFVRQGGCIVVTADSANPRTLRLKRSLPALGFAWLEAADGTPASGWATSVGGFFNVGRD